MVRKSGFAHEQRGLTFIRLLLVIVILGIAASLAVPRFRAVVMKATQQTIAPIYKAQQQAQVRRTLKEVYAAQRLHWLGTNTYGCDGATASASNPDGFAALSAQIIDDTKYTYTMVADSSTFTCTATANSDDDPTDDIWQIDETGTLVCISNNSGS